MATAKRTTLTLRNKRRRPGVPNPSTSGGTASASCGSNFLFPTKGLTFFHLDTINVSYRSDLVNPTLSCWCGTPWRATQKLRADHASSFNGSAAVSLNLFSDGPCWFELASDSGDCRDTSEAFLLSPGRRAVNDESESADDTPGSTTTHSLVSTTSTLTARTPGAVDSQSFREDSFSTGAKAALGIGIALTCIAIGAMAAFLYFRRRRRGQNGDVTSGIMDHHRRNGRKGAEKKRKDGSSDASGRSDEPLCPIQPVFDGYPGSMGYEDVRSLHSTTYSHSPTGAQSPTHSHTGAPWTYERSIEREELTAARLRSQLNTSAPTVVSYGPNPVTPTLTPRINSRVSISSSATPISAGGIDAGPHVPMEPISEYTDYTHYNIPPSATIPDTEPSPPIKPAIPIVVSYGPNKVTPTPVVVSPTVPPDESIVKRRYQEATTTTSINTSSSATGISSYERQFSWETDSPLLGVGGGGASMGPLPPYASTEDFEAMEKGAVRQLAEPKAEAELPPTKDGFYHYTSDIVEYELPGAAPQRGPQLPFRPFKTAHGNPAAGVGDGGAGVGGGGVRDIDEQKFLLEDEEIARMRAEKAKIRAAAAASATAKATREEEEAGKSEEYDLGAPLDRR